MLETRRRGHAEQAPGPGTATRSHEVTEVLLGVLGGIGSYDGRILQAEGDGDTELAGFLRELRRQDALRARGVVRLLRRPTSE